MSKKKSPPTPLALEKGEKIFFKLGKKPKQLSLNDYISQHAVTTWSLAEDINAIFVFVSNWGSIEIQEKVGQWGQRKRKKR